MLIRQLLRTALPLLCLALAACGDEPDDASDDTPVRPVIVLDPLPDETRARYALERLATGPEAQRVLRIPKAHLKNLDLAHRDLVALGPVTLRLLDDSALVERLTGSPDANPWHGVLSALTAIRDKGPDVVLRWTEPAVDRNDVQLRRRAVRCLTTVEDPRAADLLLRFLERDARDRMIGPLAFRAMAFYGTPYIERALTFAYRRGSPRLWGQVPQLLRTSQRPDADESRLASAMAWWNAAVEASGPELSSDLPRDKRFAFCNVRAWLDPSVARYTLADEDGNEIVYTAQGALPSAMSLGSGAFASTLIDQCVVPAQSYYVTGRVSAAEARCSLAMRGFAPFVRAREADLALEEVDPAIYYTALHCTSEMNTAGDSLAALGKLEKALEAIGKGEAVSGEDVNTWVRTLPDPAADLVSRALLFRVLYEARPTHLYKDAIEGAFDRLSPWQKDLLGALEELAFSGDEESRALVLNLIRRSRATNAIPIVERLFEEAGTDGTRELRQLLVFLYSRGAGIEPERYLAFVERFRSWLRALPEREVAGLATALLDFEEAGARAMSEELRGERRPLFLAALSTLDRVLPLEVAQALVEPIERGSDPGEIATVLRIAYLTFPASAANDLASLRARMPKDARSAVDVALNRVRHRADLR